MRGASFGETLLQDIRFGLRMLRKNRGFTTVAVLTLAFGIGLCTTIFSMVNPILFQPVPFAEPDRLFYINEKNPKQGFSDMGICYADYCHWRKENRVFADVGVHNWSGFTLTGTDQPERLSGSEVSATR